MALGAALVVAVATAAPAPRGLAQGLMPYPMEACRALADALAGVVPLPKPFSAEREWFRDGDLGLKGLQCRISAKGRAEKGAGTGSRPGLDDLAKSVAAVLEAQGFKRDELLDRYKMDEAWRRGFALRKDRATCRVDLARAEDEPRTGGPAQAKASIPHVPGKAGAAVWRLTVDCFVG